MTDDDAPRDDVAVTLSSSLLLLLRLLHYLLLLVVVVIGANGRRSADASSGNRRSGADRVEHLLPLQRESHASNVTSRRVTSRFVSLPPPSLSAGRLLLDRMFPRVVLFLFHILVNRSPSLTDAARQSSCHSARGGGGIATGCTFRGVPVSAF